MRRVPSRSQPREPGLDDVSRLAAEAVDQSVKPVEVELGKNLHLYLQGLGLIPPMSSAAGHKTVAKYPVAQSLSQRWPPRSFSSPHQPLQQQYRYGPGYFQAPESKGGLLQYLIGNMEDFGVPSSPLLPSHSDRAESPKSRVLKMETAGSSSKDLLTSVDERFIQKVLKNVGRQHVDVDDLTPQDLDQLSNLIANALQVVDQDQRLNPRPNQAGPGPRNLQSEQQEEEESKEEMTDTSTDEEKEKVLKNDPSLKPQGIFPIEPASLQDRHTGSEEMKVKDTMDRAGNLLTKLLAYLDKPSHGASPSVRNLNADLTDTSAGKVAGQENVQSQTIEAGVVVQKKDATQAVEEVSEVEGWIKEVAPPPASLVYGKPREKTMQVPELELDVKDGRKKADDDVFGYVIIDTDGLQTDEGVHLMEILARRAKIQMTDVAEFSVVSPAVTFRVNQNRQNVSTADVANVAVQQKADLEKETRLRILEAGVADGKQIKQIPTKYSHAESTKFLVLTVVSILCIVAVLLASTVVYCLRHRSHHKIKEKLTNLGTETSGDATATYQELCRQRMAVKPPSERPESVSSRINSVSSQFSDGGGVPALSPSARSSVSSWSEEPVHSNMDISTGHMILSYMEDHLKNKDRLEKEWEALCAYQAEPNACTVGLKDGNAKKNRSAAVVAYDHSRITLKVENSQGNSDYINASPIMDHDPRNPAYIATQGPLPSTVADFWQMVWENGCVVIVMLTPLVEGGLKQCYHYWPDEGSNLYHIYEVNLVSEHIWCDDFLVRSFYLKNMQTNETRTVTQFHFLTWLNHNVPESSRTLLDFRRKVNKCYRGRSCPVIVHCSDGSGRSGTYVLIDMVLNKMAKGGFC
ncbi:receptor-type tyrosine-protein phosphatase N2-like isoform X2 [Cynoglossus semilaevis]|nr:receptor-type tyrosine-protein phosphatase N2-like isoform X2 [Cynoglossus semilaevis]